MMNIFLTELGRSLWENLDLGHAYRTNAVRSVLHDDLDQYFFIQIFHSVMRAKLNKQRNSGISGCYQGVNSVPPFYLLFSLFF